MNAVRRRPRIALTIGKANTARALAARVNYVEALERAQAEVVILEPGNTMADEIEGLCLAGGPDISPARYGDSDPRHLAREPDLERDDLEFEAIQRALQLDIPVLGICRGFQLVNVAMGGKLLLHVEGHEPPEGPDSVRLHTDVLIDPLSKVAAACGGRALVVNSRHHQAVTSKELSPSLRATALVGDLIEAFESDKYRRGGGVPGDAARILQEQLGSLE